MGKIPDELRKIIAANIRAERVKKFPGRGGGQQCAAAFGVSPQQWSPWESGRRTPDETRLRRIADFFGVTVEHMRRDNSSGCNTPGASASPANEPPPPEPSLHAISCAESEIIWQMQRLYSGVASDGQRLQVSLNITLAKER